MGAKNRDPTSLSSIAHQHHAATAIGDGATTEFNLPCTVSRADDVRIYVAGLIQAVADRGTPHDYQIVNGNRVRFTAAPAGGAVIVMDACGG